MVLGRWPKVGLIGRPEVLVQEQNLYAIGILAIYLAYQKTRFAPDLLIFAYFLSNSYNGHAIAQRAKTMRLLNDTQLDIDDETLLNASKVIEEQIQCLGKSATLPVPPQNSPGLIGDVEQSKKVALMSALGMDDRQIGTCLGIHPKVLRQVFGPVLQQASLIANAQVAKVALTQALAGDKDMVKFWLQTRAGWKVTNTVEHKGKIEHEVSAARRKLLDGLDVEDAEIVREPDADGQWQQG